MTATNGPSSDATRDQATVMSSARDPIDRWLDVFVRLLRVPKADAKRIRDELEDHLRARVDDLMLIVHAEPEAVRVAAPSWERPPSSPASSRPQPGHTGDAPCSQVPPSFLSI